jgi:hypothetical protein
MKSKSPYLQYENRLADVIAAIQVMGAYKFYKLDFSNWADRITGDKNNADYWKKIFEQHPEFFRLDSLKEKASLVWRRQYPKRYNVDTNAIITKEEFYRLTDADKLRISRNPLEAETIRSLVQTAIDLHSRALDHLQDRRWWIPLAASTIGGLVGAIIGGAFGN